MKKVIGIVIAVIVIAGLVYGGIVIKEKVVKYKKVYEVVSESTATMDEIEKKLEDSGITKEKVQSVLDNEEARDMLKDMGLGEGTIEGLEDYDPEAIEEAKDKLSTVDKSNLMEFATKYGGDFLK